jgi:hypothetical protein
LAEDIYALPVRGVEGDGMGLDEEVSGAEGREGNGLDGVQPLETTLRAFIVWGRGGDDILEKRGGWVT